jgi:hypothetical protein
VKNGKTPVLTQDEARERLEKIDTSTSLGLRNRALIAMMNDFPPNAYYVGSNVASPSCTPSGTCTCNASGLDLICAPHYSANFAADYVMTSPVASRLNRVPCGPSRTSRPEMAFS